MERPVTPDETQGAATTGMAPSVSADGTIAGTTYYEKHVTSWRELSDSLDALSGEQWVYRGHASAAWGLETSLDRQFGARAAEMEQRILWQFVRTAPRFLPSHLVPHGDDAAAWLGLIQHYGGPTRLLDVTRSPYVGLFFAFEPSGDQPRALWAINHHWCITECARTMAGHEEKAYADVIGRTTAAQAQLVYSLVHRRAHADRLFAGFIPFTGVFALDPWKPDPRQSAQQALFLCVADVTRTFVGNLELHRTRLDTPTMYRLVVPASMRSEILGRLASMNVTAATLFPGLDGLARSLRTADATRWTTALPRE